MIIDDIIKSQNGEEDSTLLLIEKFNPLLKKYAYKLKYEDAYNDLLIDFIELLHNIQINRIHNKSEGGMVSYLSTSVHSSYIKKLNEIIQLKNLLLYSDLNDSELYYIEALSSSYDIYPTLDFDDLKKLLTPSEIIIIKMIYYIGYTVAEIATFYGVSRQAVNQMRSRALKKLKRFFLKN
jgi:RNA polymerase sigma factor (sigma-70 family)